MTSLHAELSGPHKFWKKKINIIFKIIFWKTPLYVSSCVDVYKDWLTVVNCGAELYYHVYPLLIFVNDEDDMINDEPLN